MGSEHYCLRWNNHQSNLLGVFSQLLQDESLVDVTLACSEGASIRAHKVVLSACSTYFQSLFLEHPTRHPIIILKDVRYPELRTLVDFMYKGEVNVQYCQLSALLKTAESLKVKGLAEMTNQNTALREPERDSERLRPHSAITTKSEPIDIIGNTSLPLKSSTSVLSTITSPNRLDPERCSPLSPQPPPPSSSTRLQQTLSPTPLDLYQRKNNRDPDNQLSETPSPANDITKDERPSSPEDDDAMSNDIGINMTINSNALHTSAPPSVVVPPIPTSLPSHPTDLRPPSRGGPNSTTPSLLTNSSSTSREQLLDSGSRLTMPESLPGPSGMGPVQQVPLSLKKEIEWDRHEDKLIPSDSGISDFRHPHDNTEATDIPGGGQPPDQGGSIFPCMYCGASFTNQTKLTRHILSHSLESLKFRESTHLFVSHLNIPPHDLQQHFPPLRPGPLQMEPLEPPDGGPMDIEFQSNSSTGGGMGSGSISGNMGVLTPGNSTSCSDQGSVVLCKFCGKSFPDVSSLITHLPVHTGDRPFKCEYCGKAFKLRHHMKDHCRVHTGERPFRCGMCGKTFSRSTILKAHEKTHYPKYVRKFLSSPSPVDSKDESPQ